MKDDQVLKQVAEMAGLADSYVSAWGDEAQVENETLRRLLSALGYDTKNDDALMESALKRQRPDVLAPVKVVRNGEPMHITLHLGISARASDFSWKLTTEQGVVMEGWLQSQLISDDRENGGPLVFALPDDLAWGYHKLEVFRKRRKSPFEMTLIVTPTSCYKQQALLDDKKLWGTSVQLYSVRTNHNWGIGDFGDLKQLVADIAARGGDFVGLNPIHSLFPANPEGASPYSPSSRRWLNLMYIDVSSVSEFAQCDAAQQLVGSTEFQQRLVEARNTNWVNYSEVSCLKMAVLPLLFDTFSERHLDNNTERAKQFLQFVEEGGESLLHQAAFDALHADLKKKDDNAWGWPVFPEEYRHFDNAAVKTYIKDNAKQVQLYMYLQWLADTQLAEVNELAEEKGMAMGLYRDLAVGVCDSGAETWADHGALCQDVSVGAPPDILGPLGQNWGLPPLNPEALKETAYEPYIQLLRANMRNCGALRIDHVLGLLRLWWIPKGELATQGAYMYYPVDDMMAILALESHRFQCTVIGEDLGTVPDEIIGKLSTAGIHSYKVFFFETAEDGGFYSPAHYPSQSMAALCTHDMPTLRGFWHCDDLKMGEELGLYPDKEQLAGLFASRAESKQKILDSLDWHGYLPEGVGHDASYVPMDLHLSEGMQMHLAASSSALLSLQLEDWLEMDKPVNIPGTVDEYPNWRRKLSTTLDDLFTRQDIIDLTRRLTDARGKASQKK
ncbi:4-alpha-glucanotransferase [Photobacterium profundum]|uniref:4-alpha-glucanotransferase n=1 Tax=Photobacterium profundum 3TCK TaxID=314280 RepID=Q1Z6R8_9GAMM|nr:4-alpha-glucanotransferase [Photobacterium profundum]EAS44079.1 putative 4-alpha-glucanotransferase [Photobacterium profundum 3TCK]PSV57305.1 4-alpha-glucanotransferase [Photobacterium profundum]